MGKGVLALVSRGVDYVKSALPFSSCEEVPDRDPIVPQRLLDSGTPSFGMALQKRSFAERAERASEALKPLTQNSGKPLLYGKLDFAAERLEQAVTVYERFHDKNPVLAEYALSAGMVISKGLTCALHAAPAGAALGAVVGAPFGPAGAFAGAAKGALYMGGRGFIVCAQAAIAQDAAGRIIHSVAGEHIDSYIGTTVDSISPSLEKLDPRLAETGRGRLAATGLLFAGLSAVDVKLGTAGLLRVIHKALPARDVIKEAFIRSGLYTATEIAEASLTTIEHGMPSSLQELVFRRATQFGAQDMASSNQAEFFSNQGRVHNPIQGSPSFQASTLDALLSNPRNTFGHMDFRQDVSLFPQPVGSLMHRPTPSGMRSVDYGQILRTPGAPGNVFSTYIPRSVLYIPSLPASTGEKRSFANLHSPSFSTDQAPRITGVTGNAFAQLTPDKVFSRIPNSAATAYGHFLHQGSGVPGNTFSQIYAQARRK